MEKLTVQGEALLKFRPKKEVKESEATSYFPKEELFDKVKNYISKGKAMAVQADWVNINIGGVKIALIKGQAIAKSEIGLFSESDKEALLDTKKGRKSKDVEVNE